MMLRTTIRNLLIESRYVSPMNYPHIACKVIDIAGTGDMNAYFLFHSDIYDFLENAEELKNNPDVHESGRIRMLYSGIKDIIIGYAEVRVPQHISCNNAVEIKLIAADSPYGPTLYDIILADNHGVFSDSSGTKPRAISVYEKYLTSRPDVEVRYLDSTTNSSTKKFKGDDCFGRDYYPLWDIEDYYPDGESEVNAYDRAVLYKEYPKIVDIPLEQEQLYGLSFHLYNQNIEYEVSDLLSDPIIHELSKVFGPDGDMKLLNAGNSYFDRMFNQ